MTLKTAIHYTLPNPDIRYIQRINGNTLFNVRTYNPSLLDEEDIFADDWCIPHQEKISYRESHLRFGKGYQE